LFPKRVRTPTRFKTVKKGRKDWTEGDGYGGTPKRNRNVWCPRKKKLEELRAEKP